MGVVGGKSLDFLSNGVVMDAVCSWWRVEAEMLEAHDEKSGDVLTKVVVPENDVTGRKRAFRFQLWNDHEEGGQGRCNVTLRRGEGELVFPSNFWREGTCKTYSEREREEGEGGNIQLTITLSCFESITY